VISRHQAIPPQESIGIIPPFEKVSLLVYGKALTSITQ